jgi:hypothetical protein
MKTFKLILLALCLYCTVPAQEATKTVLIAKSNSWLENTVSALVTDSLVKIGYKVTILDLKAILGENVESYSVTVVFDGIKTARVIESVDEYAKKSKEKKYNFILFRLTGDIHDVNSKIDAITAATKNIKPPVVAAKIVSAVVKATK